MSLEIRYIVVVVFLTNNKKHNTERLLFSIEVKVLSDDKSLLFLLIT